MKGIDIRVFNAARLLADHLHERGDQVGLLLYNRLLRILCQDMGKAIIQQAKDQRSTDGPSLGPGGASDGRN